MKQLGSGAAIHKGVKWHPELDDKAAGVTNHIHWACRNCNEDPEELKAQVLNIVQHYKNIHEMCPSASRCWSDLNYEPSKKVITDKKAERLLLNVLTQSQIYKNPSYFHLAKETSYVESFNNHLNMWHDKRIKFGQKQFRTQSELAVISWNETTPVFQKRKDIMN